MKYLLVILPLFLCSILSRAGQENFATLPPENIQNYMQTATIAEDGQMSGTAVEQAAFVDYVKWNWVALLDEIESIAPHTHEQMLIIAAAEYMPGRDYLVFFNRLCDQKAVNKITSQAFENAVVAITPKKIGLFAYNYQDSQVRQLMQKIQGMVPQAHKLQLFLANVLSGKAIDAAEFATVGQGLPAPETLPVILNATDSQ